MIGFRFTRNNFKFLEILVIVLAILLVSCYNKRMNSNKTNIENSSVKDKYNSLVGILGNPNYLEKDGKNNMNSATWMSPLNSFNDFGKYGGCDYIKILGNPSKKYHPYPADVYLIAGKYINVPEHLFGPIKYASETINIEQLVIPQKYAEKYFNTGKKEIALVTGSCASITISVITVKFVMDMIEKYREEKHRCLDLYEIFRREYDRRIHNYLCGKGITEPIEWFDPTFFDEPSNYNIGKKCKKSFLEVFDNAEPKADEPRKSS